MWIRNRKARFEVISEVVSIDFANLFSNYYPTSYLVEFVSHHHTVPPHRTHAQAPPQCCGIMLCPKITTTQAGSNQSSLAMHVMKPSFSI